MHTQEKIYTFDMVVLFQPMMKNTMLPMEGHGRIMN